jgi:hypothetical protein
MVRSQYVKRRIRPHLSRLLREVRKCHRVSTYFLCNPLAVVPSPEGNVESPWKVLIEVPSNDPDKFLAAARLASLEALKSRLGGGIYVQAMSEIAGPPARPVLVERQDHIREEHLGDEHGIWNTLRYWFTDRLLERGGDE